MSKSKIEWTDEVWNPTTGCAKAFDDLSKAVNHLKAEQANTTREVPFLMSTAMVQAILAGRKTQTRRIITPQPDDTGLHDHTRFPMALNSDLEGWWGTVDETGEDRRFNPKCEVGDLIWVRETWRDTDFLNLEDENYGIIYKASENGQLWEAEDEGWYWKPSIYMPKAAARIWLRCTGVKAERVQDISEADIMAEGVRYPVSERGCVVWEMGDNNSTLQLMNMLARTCGRSGEDLFMFVHWAKLWIDINGRESWDANPWVWAYSFEVLSTTGLPESSIIDQQSSIKK